MRSPTTVHSSPIAAADSAPETPDWLLSNDAPSPPPCSSTDACPVCLCEFSSHSRGPETPFHWPHCGHALHLGCVAHLVADVRELRCPTCRARWPPEAANAFTTACHAQGVEAPQLAPDHDTTSRQYHNSTAPRPPSHILPRGCSSQTPRMPPRMPHGKNCQIATCIGLPSIPGKPDAGGRSGYACAAMPRLMKTILCYSTCQNHRPAPLTARGGSRWTCASSAAGGFAAEGPYQKCCPARAKKKRVPLPDPLQPPLVPEQPALVSTALSTEVARFNQGPPDNLAAGNTNSWLFVPLLHAAVGRLHPSALAAWEAHAHYALLAPHRTYTGTTVCTFA